MLKPLSYHTLVFPSTQWPIEAILGMPLPLTALPKGVKMGNNGDIDFVLLKSLNANTGVTSYLSVPEYGITNASNFKCGITSGSNPKKG